MGAAGHHDLCFGCGAANVFGLHVEPVAAGTTADRLEARFFVKQDHQGPHGALHEGVLGAALVEAMGLAAGEMPRGYDVEHHARAPVGSFVRVDAGREPDGSAWAVATGEGGAPLARARATFDLPPAGNPSG